MNERSEPSAREALDVDRVLPALDAPRELGEAWTQIDVAAVPSLDGLDALARLVLPWLRERRVGRWWFLHKPPGVRVRLEHGLGARLTTGDLEAFTPLGPWRVGAYEPEVHRFGGPAGLDVAHDHFALDTALAVRLARLGAAAPDRRVWSVVALGDLAGRLLDDAAEHWDVWKRWEAALEEIDRSAPGSPDRRPALAPERLSRDTAALAACDTGELGTLLGALRAGQARVATSLLATADVPRRAWLSEVGVFHWNRLGLSTAELAPLIAAVVSLLESPA